ncbi:MAG: hypothetical protein JEZ14_13725 [Marinilabiliaceae bacterium]|nr:hypothetical protein [Marinilabiliaceae bacterium]
MKMETRKMNLINWLTTVQEEGVLEQLEKIQEEFIRKTTALTQSDQEAIGEGLDQLDNGDYLTRSQVRKRIGQKLN